MKIVERTTDLCFVVAVAYAMYYYVKESNWTVVVLLIAVGLQKYAYRTKRCH